MLYYLDYYSFINKSWSWVASVFQLCSFPSIMCWKCCFCCCCFLVVFLVFKSTFYLIIDLSLQKSFKDSTECFHMPYTQFSLLLTTYISLVHFSQLINQYLYIIINWRPYFTQISLVFTQCSFSVPGSYPDYFVTCFLSSSSCDDFSDFPCFW